MPFTASHIAAILPLQRTRLPLAALVVGAMVPDAPLFAGVDAYAQTHSLLGTLTTDALIGAVLLTAWRSLWRQPTLWTLPNAIRARWPDQREAAKGWLWLYLGLVVGSMTHVLWDGWTHRSGTFVELFPLLRLRAPRVDVPIYKLLQWSSSILGLFATTVWFALRPIRPIHDHRPIAILSSDQVRTLGWAALIGASVTIGLAWTERTSGLQASGGAFFSLVTRSCIAWLVLWSIAAVALRVGVRRMKLVVR
ncbi:MAG: DUF4184 family protein [Deltaproteobacteria bacterium]|nr:DUF4184 family protein [Deltaproteobacteria bacterium]